MTATFFLRVRVSAFVCVTHPSPSFLLTRELSPAKDDRVNFKRRASRARKTQRSRSDRVTAALHATTRASKERDKKQEKKRKEQGFDTDNYWPSL